MIALLTGTVTPLTTSSLVVLVGGVGYKVFVPPSIFRTIIPTAATSLFIHTHVREDALELYGFSDKNQLSLFELLLSVSGIGPKTALPIVDRGVDAVGKAIVDSDVDFFTTIPRLGRKNAQKIIIELKSKLGSTRDLDLAGETDGETQQLIDALMSMGFAKSEVLEAIRKIEPEATTVEQKIRRALQLISSS